MKYLLIIIGLVFFFSCEQIGLTPEIRSSYQEGVSKGYSHKSIVAKGNNYDNNQFQALWTDDTFVVELTTDSSMLYDIWIPDSLLDSLGDKVRSSDQSDISKITGFTDSMPYPVKLLDETKNYTHHNSFRLGYNCDSSEAQYLSLYAYCYVNKNRKVTALHKVPVGAKVLLKVVCLPFTYHVKAWYDNNLIADTLIDRGIMNPHSVKRYQALYWGGRNDQTGKDNTAPHDVELQVKFMKNHEFDSMAVNF